MKRLCSVWRNSYRTHLREYAEDACARRLVFAPRRQDADRHSRPSVEAREYRERIAAKARASVAEYLFPKITDVKDGHRRIVDQPPLVFHLPEQSRC